ncbi:unnamed protein product [Amoebophrya sp. A120]|nr:unnamed protein product [Amoebophrya sp. A120]|eukprot:GSA120T00013539001.1
MLFVPAAPAPASAKGKRKTFSMSLATLSPRFSFSRERFFRRGASSCSSLSQKWLASSGLLLLVVHHDKTGQLLGVQEALAVSFMSKMKMKLQQNKKKTSTFASKIMKERLPARGLPRSGRTGAQELHTTGGSHDHEAFFYNKTSSTSVEQDEQSFFLQKHEATLSGATCSLSRAERGRNGGPGGYGYCRNASSGMVKSDCKLCMRCSGRSWLKYIDTATGSATSWQLDTMPRSWRELEFNTGTGELLKGGCDIPSGTLGKMNHKACLEKNLDKLYEDHAWNEQDLDIDTPRLVNLKVNGDVWRHYTAEENVRCEARMAMKKSGASGSVEQRFDNGGWETAPSGSVDWKTQMAPVGWHKVEQWKEIGDELEEAAQRLGDNFFVVSLSAFAPSCGSEKYCGDSDHTWDNDENDFAAHRNNCECKACCEKVERDGSWLATVDKWRCGESGFYSIDDYAREQINSKIQRASIEGVEPPSTTSSPTSSTTSSPSPSSRAVTETPSTTPAPPAVTPESTTTSLPRTGEIKSDESIDGDYNQDGDGTLSPAMRVVQARAILLGTSADAGEVATQRVGVCC